VLTTIRNIVAAARLARASWPRRAKTLSRFARELHYYEVSLPNVPLSLAAFSLLSVSGAVAFAQGEAPSVDVEVCNSLDAGEVSSILEGESQQQPATSVAISCADEIATVRVARRDSTIVVLQADLRVVEPIARARTIALLIAEMKPLEARVGHQPSGLQPAVVVEPKLSNEAYFATHLLQLSTELGFASREFQYEGSGNSPEIHSYSGTAIPTTKLRVQVNPWHNSTTTSALQGFGARIAYGFALPFESYGSEMVAIDTRWREWEASLRAQKRFASSVIGVELGLGAQQFEFVETASNWAITVDLPGVDYRYRRIGVDAGVPVSDVLALELALEYRLVNNVGAIGQHFNASEASAWAGMAALRYRITNDFSAQLSYKAARYEQTYSMSLGAGNASGRDSFDSLLLGLRAGI
tara:strand:- start:216450 stop:217685 length:1236 start_codon:yes stop_codon:yes gene_type:complete